MQKATKSEIGQQAWRRSIAPLIALIFIGLVGTLMPAKDANALPAFARRYHLVCNACHTREPRLNAFGERFFENGFQLPGSEDGDVAHQIYLGNTVNHAALNDASNYFAVRIRGQAVDYQSDQPSADTNRLDISHMILDGSIFTAGPITKNISFFGEFAGSTQDSVVLNTASLQFTNLVGYQDLNVILGAVQTDEFFAYPNDRNQINSLDGSEDDSGSPVGYDRIPIAPAAFNLNMFGLTTGNANLGAGGGFGLSPYDPFGFNGGDNEEQVSLYGRPFQDKRFLYSVGLAQNHTAEDNPQIRHDIFVLARYDFFPGAYQELAVSGFYYKAPSAVRATVPLDPTTDPGDPACTTFPCYQLGQVEDVDNYGLGARWYTGPFDIYSALVWHKIDSPRFTNPGAQQAQFKNTGMGFTVEADYLFNDKWLGGVRYDYASPGGLEKLPPLLQGTAPEINQKYSYINLLAKYYPAPNFAIYGQFTHNLNGTNQLPLIFGGGNTPATNNRNVIAFGFDWGF
ncbi:MAG: hypothetical protein ACRETO_05190 [Gammaproteobacteria bacterium]